MNYEEKRNEILNNFGSKISRILNSNKFKDLCKYEQKKYDRDLFRLSSIFKEVATCANPKNFDRMLPDNNFDLEKSQNDVLEFYTELDNLTDNKHNFVKKVKEQERYIRPSKDRASVSLKKLGDKILKEINLSKEKVVASRTTAIHELWHAIDERNYKPTVEKIGKGNPLLGEIGSMFIEDLSKQYLKSKYSYDRDFTNKLNYITIFSHNLNNVNKATDAYFDCLVMFLVNDDKNNEGYRQWAEKELINNYKVLWGPAKIDEKLNKINDYINGKSNFDLLYEGRYVIAEIINNGVKESDLPLSAKVDLMAELNDNLINLQNLNKYNLTSDFDIVTSHFQIKSLETLTDNYTNNIKNLPDIPFSRETSNMRTK